MRRTGRIAAFGIILLAAAYSTAWWYAADQSRLFLRQSISNTAPDASLHLQAQRIKLSGYPFHIGLLLERPQIKSAMFEASAEEPVLLERTISGSEYRVVLPKVLHFIENGIKRDCEYASKPTATLRVNPLTLEKHMLFKGPESFEAVLNDPKLAEAFRSMHYQDGGSYCVTENGLETTRNEGVRIDVSTEPGEKGRTLTVEANVKKPQVTQPNTVMDMAVVGLAFDLQGLDSLRTKGAAKDAVLDVHSFLLDAGDFSSNLTGHLEWNSSSALPYGALELKLANFPKLIAMIEKRMAAVPEEKSASLPKINEAKLVALVEKLGQVPRGAKDATIKIDWPQNSMPTIGGMPAAQFMKEINAVRIMPAAEPAPEPESEDVPESDDAVTQPVMPEKTNL